MNKNKMDNNSKLYSVHKTLTKMLDDRGYDVKEENELSREDFRKKFSDPTEMKGLIYSKKDDKERIMVSYLISENKGGSVGINQFKEYLQTLQEYNIKRGIIVIESSLSADVQNKISEIRPDTYIEVFIQSKLMFPIVEHRYVPPHIKLSKSEKEDFITKMKLNRNKLATTLPLLRKSDPIRIYYDFNDGDIIKILRSADIRDVLLTDDQYSDYIDNKTIDVKILQNFFPSLSVYPSQFYYKDIGDNTIRVYKDSEIYYRLVVEDNQA